MTGTTQEELPPYDIVDPGRFGYGWRADTIRPCIATLKAENERLHTLLIDAESVMVRQRDDRLAQGARAQAAQSTAAAMAGLLEEARAVVWRSGTQLLLGKIDRTLAAWKDKP
jgi:hypothetical protein